jgi:hypothetical protein
MWAWLVRGGPLLEWRVFICVIGGRASRVAFGGALGEGATPAQEHGQMPIPT